MAALIVTVTGKDCVLLTRDHILLAADRDDTDEAIGYALNAHLNTVAAVRMRCVKAGLERTQYDASRPGDQRNLNYAQ